MTATASVTGTAISDNRFAGIQLRSGSRAEIEHTAITDNGGSGVAILENSTVTLLAGSITGNGRSGIFLAWHSLLRNFSGTVIADNVEDGLKITQDSGVQLGAGTHIPPNGSGLAIVCVGKESSIDYQDGVIVDQAFVDCEDPDF